MTKRKSAGGAEKGVNPKLQKYLNQLLDDVMAPPKAVKEGEKAAEQPSLTDKMKVIDRALKLDAIRLKVQDEGEGGFFKKKGVDENGDT